MDKIFNRILVSTATMAVILVTGAASLNAPSNMTLSKGSRLWLEGTSSVKSFKCTASKFDVDVVAEANAAPADLAKKAVVTVPVSALDCANDTMNGHMRKALKGTANPQITWKLDSYTINIGSVLMTGTLNIAGKENAVTIAGTGNVESNGTLRIKGTKQFKMTEYGVKPPSLMLGTMKVRDPVTVGFDLVLTK